MKTRSCSPSAGPDPVRRRLSVAIAAGVFASPLIASFRVRAAEPVIEVWTGPSCSCCHEWVAHLEANGFDVDSHDGGNQAARERLGMPVRYGSCHTGVVDGYALEGHVPAREVERLLAERPDAVGLSVPAMPRGSPGMDGPAYDGVQDPYDVLLIGHDGTASVFESYR